MKRQIIRVEPLASLLDKYKAPTSTVVRHGVLAVRIIIA
jgi:2-iminobutanoate/2-iminopropanoate deaminase